MARESCRKTCAKCNITAAEDKNLSFHRFPLPGKHGISRIRVWAEYCYPDKDWSTEKSLKDLHFQHKMVCSKHFDGSSYTNSARTRLNIFAVPTGAQELLKDTNTSVDKSQFNIMENNLECRDIKSVKKYNLEPNCSTIKQEVEMDIGETSIASTSLSNKDTTMESNSKVSADQTSILCNFFEENPEVIRGYKRTPKYMDKIQIKWKNITPHLNAVGPPRDHRSWAKYLCDMKTKLKRKNIKWKQNCDSKDPIMCNINDFNEIRLRMLQVLRKDVPSSQESQDAHTDGLQKEDNNNYNENFEMDKLPVEVPDVKPKLECLEHNRQVTINYTPPPDFQPHVLVFEDEFDYFGKNVAEQLKTLPLLVALETQEMLLSVLKKQRLKVLQNSDPLSHN